MGLFQPDWMSKDLNKAYAGLQKLAGQTYLRNEDREKKLEKVALKAKLPEIRLAAAKAGNAYKLYFKLAKEDPDVRVRATLISEDSFYRLYNKSDFLKLLSSEKNPDVRMLIQSLIDRKNQEEEKEQREKLEEERKIQEQKAREEEYELHIQSVKDKLNTLSQDELILVLSDPLHETLSNGFLDIKYDVKNLLRDAVSNLKDQQAIYKVALNTSDKMTRIENTDNPNLWSIQQTAVNLLQDQKLMELLILKTEEKAVRFALLEKIENQRVISDFIKTCQPDDFDFYCYKARVSVNDLLERITDEMLLKEIIQENGTYAKEADIRLQKLESETLCPGNKHNFEEIDSDTRMYDNEIIIHEYTYRCSRCNAHYQRDKWDSGKDEKGDIYFVPRVKVNK